MTSAVASRSGAGLLRSVRWILVAVPLLVPGRVQAQAFRGWTGTSVQVIELRPVGVDTVPRSEVLTDALGGFLYQGFEVSCSGTDVCTGYLPLAEDRTVAATQDLSLTAWGFGVEGLSVSMLLRARAHTGGDLVWPRSDDEFDALFGYAELLRGSYRVRLGRQDVRSGLGFSSYDGASAAWGSEAYRVEAYGGRSLARGLREPANEALRGLDDFFIDDGVVLVGLAASARRVTTTVSARYQREILYDRSGLVSERASVDFGTTTSRGRVDGGLDYDFSFQHIGKAHLSVSAPLSGGHWIVEVGGRRYVPYFQLSTLWGFFEPVSYSDVFGRVAWSPAVTLGVALSGGWRKYGDTGATVILRPLRDDGWQGNVRATWRAAPAWTLEGRYELQWVPGGFLSSADAGVRFAFDERVTGSLTATSFQQIDQFRLGDGRAVGLGASADATLSERWSVGGGMSILRHRDGGNVFTSPWNQTRAWTSLRVDIGGDPGAANRRAP